jgi:hypothetical protein
MIDAPKPPIERISDLFARPLEHRDGLSTRITASLRRAAPEQWDRNLAQLLPVLLKAGIHEPELRDTDRVRRWAVLVHLVAVLSGTTHDRVHSSRPTGRAIHETGYSEARLSKLLTARGDGLRDQVARLARFLRAKGAQPLDLRPLAQLVLNEGTDARAAETARLSIARGYYAAADRAAKEDAE